MEDRRFFPEDIGMVVTDILVDLFPEIVDVGFTAKMEEELDDIAEGKAPWPAVVREFYEPFHADIERAEGKVQSPVVYLDEECPLCPQEGRKPGRLVEKLGRYGKFIGCENYPECRYTRPLEGEAQPAPKPTGERCPQCGEGELVERTGRFGPFVGCSRYPECKYIKKEPPKSTGITCPTCSQGELVERRGRFGPFYSCSRYPECDFSVNWTPLRRCPVCDGLVVAARGGNSRCIACGRAWDEQGEELPEEEAKALIPKSRQGGRSRGSGSRRSTRAGSSRSGARPGTRRTA
jgi:DNA topoisomerase-1